MDPSSRQVLAEILRSLGAKLTEGASSIGYEARTLTPIFHTDPSPTISHSLSIAKVRRPSRRRRMCLFPS